PTPAHSAPFPYTPLFRSDRRVGASLGALADQSPLQRGMFDRTAHYSALQEPSPLRPQQVVDAHTARVKTLRAQARAVRRQQTANATPPAPTTAVQSAARR